MERRIMLENNSTKNHKIFEAEQNVIYYDMERNVNSKAREYFIRKPYTTCGGIPFEGLQKQILNN